MKEKLIIGGLIATLLIPINMFSQNVKAEKYLKAAYYNEGIKQYESTLNKELDKKERALIIKRLVVAYYKDNNYPKVVELVNGLLTLGETLDSNQNYIYAQSLRSIEKYDDAKRVLKLIKTSQLIDEYCVWPKENTQFNDAYTVTSTLIGQSRKYFGMAFAENGMVFYSKKNDDELNTGGYVLRAGKITNNMVLADEGFLFNYETNKYETTPFYNSSTNELFYSANYLDRKYYIASSGEKNKVNQHSIYVAKIKKGKVKSNESLPFNSTNYSCSFPFLYQDSVLFYCSNDPVKAQNMDIFYVTRNQEGIWGEPRLLEGPNTFENEMYPLIHNGHFYFSSKGREGFGGMDIYKGQLVSKNGKYHVTGIKNMGKPINGPMDDFGLVFFNKHQAYFSSNRNLTHDEVWLVELKLQKVSGIYMVDNLPQENVEVKLLQLNEDGVWEEISHTITESDGLWELELDNTQTQKIIFQQKGINLYEFVLNTDDPPSFRKKMINALSQLNSQKGRQASSTNYLTTDIHNGKLQVVTEEGIATTISLSKEKGIFSGKGIPIKGEKKGTIYVNEETKEIFSFNGEKWEKVESASKNKYQLMDDLTKLLVLKNTIENVTNEKVDIKYELNTKETANQKSLMLSTLAYFDYKSHRLRKKPKKLLKIIANEITNNSNIKVELIGHTDGISTEEYNNVLSTKRAVASLKYMRKNGVALSQMYFTGVGEKESSHLNKVSEKDKIEYVISRKVQIKIW